MPKILGYKFPAWLILVVMVGAGSLTISGAELVPQFTDSTAELPVSDVNATAGPSIPSTGAVAFTGVPVHFDTDNPLNLRVDGNGATAGVKIVTGQRIRVDLLMQAADPVKIAIPIKNESSDSQLVLVKITAPEFVMSDVSEGFQTHGMRLVGHNQWMFAVNDGANADFNLHLTSLQSNPFYVLVEVSAVA